MAIKRGAIDRGSTVRICVYSALLNSPETANLSKKFRNKRQSHRSYGVPYAVRASTVTVSYHAQHESGTITAISWSVTIYSITLSNKYNFTAQIEQVLDKHELMSNCLYFNDVS